MPALAQSRGGLYLVPQLAQGVHLLPPGCTEDFFSFSPSLAHRRGGLLLFLACTRSRARRSFSLPGASDRRKTMRTLKLLTGAANHRKTMGTLKLLTESMRYNFELALNHARMIRSFFYSKYFRHKRHANSET